MNKIEFFELWVQSDKPEVYLDQLENYCGPLLALKGILQQPEHHPEGWSIFKRDFGYFPLFFGETIPTKSITVNNRSCSGQDKSVSQTNLTFGKSIGSTSKTESVVDIFSDSISTTRFTGSFCQNFSSSFSPTIVTEIVSFISSITPITSSTDKIIRVVFKIPFRSMNRIVQSSVDNFQIFQTIILPVSVYMMNMLFPQNSSSSIKFHNISMNPNSSSFFNCSFGNMKIKIPISIISKLESDSINSDVFFDFYIFIENNTETHNNSSSVNTPLLEQYEINIGDAYVHTLNVVGAAINIAKNEQLPEDSRRLLLMSALCHDFGKATCTKFHPEKQKWVAYGHDYAGVPIAKKWLEELAMPEEEILKIITLVRSHMVHCRTIESITQKSVNKLLMQLKEGLVSWSDLVLLMRADCAGRPPLDWRLPPVIHKINDLVPVDQKVDLNGK